MLLQGPTPADNKGKAPAGSSASGAGSYATPQGERIRLLQGAPGPPELRFCSSGLEDLPEQAHSRPFAAL